MKASDLLPDQGNHNLGRPEGRTALKRVIDEIGYVRPILVDANNQILAGHHVVEANPDAEIIIVDLDGTDLLVHQIEGLDLDGDDDRARIAAYADNKTHELNARYDEPAILDAYETHHLTPYWREEEIEEMRDRLRPQIAEADPEVEEWLTFEMDVDPDLARRFKDTLSRQMGRGQVGRLETLLALAAIHAPS